MTWNTRVWDHFLAGCGKNLSGALRVLGDDPKEAVNRVLRELGEEEIPSDLEWPKKKAGSVKPSREEELAQIPASWKREAEGLIGDNWLEPG